MVNNDKKSNYNKKENANMNSKDKKGYSKNSRTKGNNYKSKKFEEKTKDRKAGTSYASDDKSMTKYVGTSNDPAWYNKNQRLIADVSKVPFGYQLGKPIEIFSAIPGTATLNNYVVPGIMTLDMVNVPGIATQSSDGVNLAATGLLQYVRKHLSTVSNAAAADFAVYVLGIDDIYSDYANLVRLFGILNAYSATNMYFGRALAQALYGISPSVFNQTIRGINDFRAWFNNLIFKASTLYLPTDFTITNRHAWLYSNYFMDSESNKAQIYAFTKTGGYKLNETKYDTGSALEFIPNQGNNLSTMLAQFEAKIDAYRNSDSMMRIAADMRRAFDGRQQWSLAYVDENYMTLPIYDKTVLSQIHNTTAIHFGGSGTIADLKDMDIKQDVDKNILIFHPYVEYSDDDPEDKTLKLNSASLGTRIFNFYWDGVTEDDIIEGTRNAVVLKQDKDKHRLYVHQCGADICVGIRAHKLSSTNPGNIITYNIPNVLDEHDISTVGSLGFIAMYAVFDWAPIIYGLNSDLESDAAPLCDIANYTTISPELLSRIHQNVAMSMWSIPEFGGFEG